MGYDSSARPFLYTGDLPKDINPMVRVVFARSSGAPVAVTLDLLREQRRIVLGDITISWREGQNSALDASAIQSGRDVGNVIARRRSPDGVAEDIPYDITFAFVVHAFHPALQIAQSCERPVGSPTANDLRIVCPVAGGR